MRQYTVLVTRRIEMTSQVIVEAENWLDASDKAEIIGVLKEEEYPLAAKKYSTHTQLILINGKDL